MKRGYLNLYLSGLTTTGKSEFIEDLSRFLRVYSPPRDNKEWDDYDPYADVIVIDETNIFNNFTIEDINLLVGGGKNIYLLLTIRNKNIYRVT